MDFKIDLALARLREAAELYRQLAKARRDQVEGSQRSTDLEELDAEYTEDLEAEKMALRQRRAADRRLEDEIQAVENKLDDRRQRKAADASTALALADEIKALERQREKLEQQLLDRWQGDDAAAESLAVSAREADAAHRRIAAGQQASVDRAAKADLALPEIEGELAHLVRQLPAPVAGRLRRLARQLDDPVANLVRGSCAGCGQALPAQEALDVDRDAQIIVCQGCGRFVVARSSRETRDWG